MVNFTKICITVFAANFFYLPRCFTYWTTRSGARYKTKIRDVHELRDCIVDEWDKLDQRIIDKVVGE